MKIPTLSTFFPSSKFGAFDFLRRHFNRVALLVTFLNVGDGLMTMIWVSWELATEANPLMNLLLQAHPALFLLAKVGLVTLGLVILGWQRRQVAALLSLAVALLVYALVVVYHALALVCLFFVTIG